MHWHLRNRDLVLGTRCLVMGIVNVTPDSFSDGGLYSSTDAAVAHGLELVQQGADILDVGGESTRPGSLPVSLDEELRRVVPVVAALAKQTNAAISIDTSKAEVARVCLESGAHIVNDITGLSGDPRIAEVVRDQAAGAIVMHMQGTPATMQIAPQYEDVVVELSRFFADRLQALVEFGISLEAVALDPGIGFGKTREHNITLLARLAEFTRFDRPICLGVSRKGFLGKLLDRPVDERLPASLAAASFGLAQNAVQILRVHDVAATRDLAVVWDTLRNVPRGT